MHIVYHEIIYFKEKIFKTYFANLDSTLIFNYGDLIGDQESNAYRVLPEYGNYELEETSESRLRLKPTPIYCAMWGIMIRLLKISKLHHLPEYSSLSIHSEPSPQVA